MKRLIGCLMPCLFGLSLVLFACAPLPTVISNPVVTPGQPDPCLVRPIQAPLCFVTLDDGDVALLSQRAIRYGSVTLRGERLEVASPYCALPECAPNERHFVRLTYPEEKSANYPQRLVIDVTAGAPDAGRALFTLEGEDFSREALLRP